MYQTHQSLRGGARRSVFSFRSFALTMAFTGLGFTLNAFRASESLAQRGKIKEVPEGNYQSSILYIGDSHTVQSFGQTLDELLRTLNLPHLRVSTYGRCGSHALSWWKEKSTDCGAFDHIENQEPKKTTDGTSIKIPKLISLVKKHLPAWTIIALGANHFPSTSSRTREHVAHLIHIAKAGGAKCIWIGPPNGRNKPEPRMSELYGDLEATTQGHCHLIDSRPLTYYPATGGDGAHYDHIGPEGIRIAKSWANAVFHQIQDVIARHPNR